MAEGRATIMAAAIAAVAGILASWITAGRFVETRLAASENRLSTIDGRLSTTDAKVEDIREIVLALPTAATVLASGTIEFDTRAASIPTERKDTGIALNPLTDHVFLSIESMGTRVGENGAHYSAYWRFVDPSVNPRAFEAGLNHVDRATEYHPRQKAHWMVIRQRQ